MFNLFGYTFTDVGDLTPEHPEYDEEYFGEWKEFAEKVNDFYCDNINEHLAEHVFYVLLMNKDFLFRFNTEVAKVVKELKKQITLICLRETNAPCNIQLKCEHCNKSKGARSRDYKNIIILF